jgi:hypothetical protein
MIHFYWLQLPSPVVASLQWGMFFHLFVMDHTVRGDTRGAKKKE